MHILGRVHFLMAYHPSASGSLPISRPTSQSPCCLTAKSPCIQHTFRIRRPWSSKQKVTHPPCHHGQRIPASDPAARDAPSYYVFQMGVSKSNPGISPYWDTLLYQTFCFHYSAIFSKYNLPSANFCNGAKGVAKEGMYRRSVR